MWLAAWLWAQKGVEMGVGWGRTPFSERRERGGRGDFQNAWEFWSWRWAGEMGARLGIPPESPGEQVGSRAWVGVSVCAWEGGRQGVGQERAGRARAAGRARK